MSEWGGKQRAACHRRMDQRLKGRAGVVSMNQDQLDLLGCLGALQEMEAQLAAQLRASGNPRCADCRRARAVLTKYRLPTEGTDAG